MTSAAKRPKWAAVKRCPRGQLGLHRQAQCERETAEHPDGYFRARVRGERGDDRVAGREADALMQQGLCGREHHQIADGSQEQHRSAAGAEIGDQQQDRQRQPGRRHEQQPEPGVGLAGGDEQRADADRQPRPAPGARRTRVPTPGRPRDRSDRVWRLRAPRPGRFPRGRRPSASGSPHAAFPSGPSGLAGRPKCATRGVRGCAGCGVLWAITGNAAEGDARGP